MKVMAESGVVSSSHDSINTAIVGLCLRNISPISSSLLQMERTLDRNIEGGISCFLRRLMGGFFVGVPIWIGTRLDLTGRE